MAIRYRAIQKGQPGIPGGGRKKYYASVVMNGTVTVEDLAKAIKKFSPLSEPEIYGVIVALESVIRQKLGESRMVRLERLGTLYPALSSEGRETAEELDAGAIRSVGVNFRPDTRILVALREAGVKKEV